MTLKRGERERGRDGEMEKIGGSGCENQEEDRLVAMDSDRLLKWRERKRQRERRQSAEGQ